MKQQNNEALPPSYSNLYQTTQKPASSAGSLVPTAPHPFQTPVEPRNHSSSSIQLTIIPAAPELPYPVTMPTSTPIGITILTPLPEISPQHYIPSPIVSKQPIPRSPISNRAERIAREVAAANHENHIRFLLTVYIAVVGISLIMSSLVIYDNNAITLLHKPLHSKFFIQCLMLSLFSTGVLTLISMFSKFCLVLILGKL
jgi:hypothetical protein